MVKPLILPLACCLMCFSCDAQENSILLRLSPGLSKLLADHPAALKVLTNSFSEVFSNRSVGVFYFYSGDDSEPKAYHFYPAKIAGPEVFICVRENQQSLDQFVTLLFETLNCRNEHRFKKLAEQAVKGAVSRQQFAREVLRIEFDAVKGVRDLLLPLSFDKGMVGDPNYVKVFTECPATFEDFLIYSKKLAAGRHDVFEDYGKQYDALRRPP